MSLFRQITRRNTISGLALLPSTCYGLALRYRPSGLELQKYKPLGEGGNGMADLGAPWRTMINQSFDASSWIRVGGEKNCGLTAHQALVRIPSCMLIGVEKCPGRKMLKDVPLRPGRTEDRKRSVP